MFAMALLCLGLVDSGGPASTDVSTYREAAAKAGKDASAQVKLALWCEAHGMSTERMKHLAAAVAQDPAHAVARGLMGLVSRGGKWERPEDVSREVKDDPGLKALRDEYFQRRARTPDKADDQLKLSQWCDENGLKEEAIAHYRAVLRLDPKRESAWHRLGFKKVKGRWVKPEWQNTAKKEFEEQHRANKRWKPVLERIRSGLESKDRERRERAEAEALQVTDPRAVPMVWAVFVPRGVSGQVIAVRLLGQIDAPGASRALAMLAISGKSGEVRGQAAQILRQRDPRDFAPILVAMIRDPIRYEVKPVQGPGKAGELVIHEGTVKRERLYTPFSGPNLTMQPGDRIVTGPDGLPVLDQLVGFTYMSIGNPFSGGNDINPLMAMTTGMSLGIAGPGATGQLTGILEKAGVSAAQSAGVARTIVGNSRSNATALQNLGPQGGYYIAEFENFLQIPIGDLERDAQLSAQVARMQLEGDVQAIDAYNAPILNLNRRIRQILKDVAGVDPGNDRSAWTKWLVDLFGYAASPQKASADQTTVIEQVPLEYVPQAPPLTTTSAFLGVEWHHSCFAAGMLVRTLDGSRRIETIAACDLVLSQDPRTGELRYRAVVTAFHNPPNSTYRIRLESGEAIVATGIHRLWKAGQGWTMARELKPGDVLRTLGGVATVQSVDPDRVQPVFNLEVAEGQSYFVGESGVLAHDNSTIHPVPEPFDAVGPIDVATAPAPASTPNPASQVRRRSMLGR